MNQLLVDLHQVLFLTFLLSSGQGRIEGRDEEWRKEGRKEGTNERTKVVRRKRGRK